MKIFQNVLGPTLFGIAIGLGGILAMGGDPFFGFFADRDEKTFPICQRDLYSYLGDDLQPKYSPTPILSFEVICGYMPPHMLREYGYISQERIVFEDGRKISSDTEIVGAAFSVECVRYKNPPQPHHSLDWLLIDDGYYCELPNYGYPLTRY